MLRQNLSQNTKRKKLVVVAAIIGVIAVGVVAYFVPSQSTVVILPIAQEEQERYGALGVAQRFVVTSDTFAFDGNINTLKTEYVGSTKSVPP